VGQARALLPCAVRILLLLSEGCVNVVQFVVDAFAASSPNANGPRFLRADAVDAVPSADHLPAPRPLRAAVPARRPQQGPAQRLPGGDPGRVRGRRAAPEPTTRC
jgi:hypothetical protein